LDFYEETEAAECAGAATGAAGFGFTAD